MEKLDNLGKLPLKKGVFAGLLPTGVKTILVKYSPEIVVSCIVAPKQFSIQYSSIKHYTHTKKYDLELKAPTLVMSCEYSDIPRSGWLAISGYSLWALDTSRDDDIYVKQYQLANIWDHGKICFGDLTPKNLRQAFNYYWTSGFNDDIKVPHLNCSNKLHKYKWHTGCVCDASKKQHVCDCSRKVFHTHYGCGCTTVEKSRKCKGRCEEKQCSCCKAIAKLQKKKAKKKDLTEKQLLKLASVKLQLGETYPGCGCTYRHKRHCPCAGNICNCPCTCDCCMKVCEHKACLCSCCRNTCNCKCKCSKLDKLKQHLTTYHEKMLPLQPWKKRTTFFCGGKYWAAPEGAEAVLVTDSRELLTRIPRKYWRRDRDGRPLIVALGNRQPSRGWEFRSGSYMFYLDFAKVVFK